jgi:biotin transport system substrate-specific component
MAARGMVRQPVLAGASHWLEGRRTSALIGVGAFVIMTALGAHVRIPLPWTPVPLTLQTLFVVLAGATLGPALGPVSQGLYLVSGTLGLPIFAGGTGGVSYLLRSATTGYLLGFVAAAALVGWLIRRSPHSGFGWIVFSMAAGGLVIYACGASWLLWSLHLDPADAVAQGVLPFLAGDVVKTCAAAGLFRAYRRRARRAFP